MALLNIQDNGAPQEFSLFVPGFRPFFLAAGIFSIVSISLWMGIYVFGLKILAYWIYPRWLFFYYSHWMKSLSDPV